MNDKSFVQTAKEQAIEELKTEREAKAKKRIKVLLLQISDAEVVVSNLNRELEDLERELAEDI